MLLLSDCRQNIILVTGAETNRKVSSMNFYSYRLMIREYKDNHILKCRRLQTHKSLDCTNNQGDVVNYPTEFLNSLRLTGLPPHNLQLKIGSVVIMLRINPPRLCNGIRISVKILLNNVIELTIFKGKYVIPSQYAFQ